MFDPLNTFANINIGDQIMSKVVTCKRFQKCAIICLTNINIGVHGPRFVTRSDID